MPGQAALRVLYQFAEELLRLSREEPLDAGSKKPVFVDHAGCLRHAKTSLFIFCLNEKRRCPSMARSGTVCAVRFIPSLLTGGHRHE